MARKAMALTALLALAAGCQQDGNVDPMVAGLARTIRMPESAGDLRLKRARGEGRTLILETEMPGDLGNVVGASDVATSFAHGICANRATMNFFSEGRTLRLDLSMPGRPPSSATVDRCPPGPVGQGVTVETYAQMYQRMVGRDLGDGTRLTSSRAEGQTLVLVLDGPAGWRQGVTPASIGQDFLGGFCEGGTGNAFFQGGRTLRVDTTEGGGAPMAGQPLSACPGR
ncbi:MAG TPA: hypothetical protein VEC11_12770 [Allosphingosinicella sp.]|nr:hypothetical protein [Allosphingosinicella sp.]